MELLLFREKLEDQGLPKADVNQKVNDEREKLMANTSSKAAPSEAPSTSNRQVPTSCRRFGDGDVFAAAAGTPNI